MRRGGRPPGGGPGPGRAGRRRPAAQRGGELGRTNRRGQRPEATSTGRRAPPDRVEGVQQRGGGEIGGLGEIRGGQSRVFTRPGSGIFARPAAPAPLPPPPPSAGSVHPLPAARPAHVPDRPGRAPTEPETFDRPAARGP